MSRQLQSFRDAFKLGMRTCGDVYNTAQHVLEILVDRSERRVGILLVSRGFYKRSGSRTASHFHPRLRISPMSLRRSTSAMGGCITSTERLPTRILCFRRFKKVTTCLQHANTYDTT